MFGEMFMLDSRRFGEKQGKRKRGETGVRRSGRERRRRRSEEKGQTEGGMCKHVYGLGVLQDKN